MSSHRHDRSGHPVSVTVGRWREEAAELAGTPVWSLSAKATREAIADLAALEGQVAELRSRLLAHGERVEVGAESGAPSTGAWLAVATRQDRPAAGAAVKLAVALDERWDQVREAMATGTVSEAQARVVVRALDELPEDLDRDVVEKAEEALVGYCAHHAPRELRVLGRRILEVVAPEVVEEQEERRLVAEEARAAKRTRFTMSRDGEGLVHGRFTLPEAQGAMLEHALLTLAAPARHRDQPDWCTRATPQRLGAAFAEWVETQTRTSIVVTMTLDALLGAGVPAYLETGEKISAGQARRLACTAGIIPAVLGGQSEVLDLGRTRRLFNHPQRVALGLRDQTCTAEGCQIPPARCHAHHDHPWSAGGATDVANGRLLCGHHHRRAHDPTYDVTRLGTGKLRFHRRT